MKSLFLVAPLFGMFFSDMIERIGTRILEIQNRA